MRTTKSLFTRLWLGAALAVPLAALLAPATVADDDDDDADQVLAREAAAKAQVEAELRKAQAHQIAAKAAAEKAAAEKDAAAKDAAAAKAAAAAARDQVAVKVAVPAALQAQYRSTQQMLERLPSLGKHRLADVLKVSSSQGTIKVEFSEHVQQPGHHRIEITDAPVDGGQWAINSSGPQPAGFGRVARYSQLTRYDFAEAAKPDGFWTATLYVNDGLLRIYATGGSGGNDYRHLQLTVQPTGVQFILNERKDNRIGPRFSATAASLLELRAAKPAEFRQFVQPLFKRLLGTDPLAVRPADAYRAFPEVPADAAVTRALARLLDRFESPAPAERQKASAELANLGVPGVLAALRIDPAALSPEQRSRLDAFIRPYDDARALSADQALADPHFLTDCLDFEDVRVRRAARRELSRLLGRDIPFDPEADGTARSASLDVVRELVLKLRPPTTQPAAAADARPAAKPVAKPAANAVETIPLRR